MREVQMGTPRAGRAGREDEWPHQDGLVRVPVAGEATGGRFALVETRARRGEGPPRHVHTREDEVVYVLEGRLTVYAGEEPLDAPAGSCVLLPRGGEHTYRVESEEARLLVLLLPAGLEGCYRELGQLMVGPDGGPGAGSDRVERLVATAARYGVEITGPGESCRPHHRESGRVDESRDGR